MKLRVPSLMTALLLMANSPAMAQWQTRPLPYSPSVATVIPYRTPAGRVLLTTGVIINSPVLYRSDDEGKNWRSNPIDRSLALFTVPAANSESKLDGPLYGIAAVGGGWLESLTCELRRSIDVGSTWVVVAAASKICNLAVDPTTPQVMYGTGVGYAGPRYKARSLDGGATWQSLQQQIPWWVYQFKMGVDGAAYAMAGTGNPFVSRDHGQTFTELTVRQQTGGSINDLLALRHPVHGDSFILVATTTGLYKSIDGGTTWLPSGLQGYEVKSLSDVPQAPGSPLQVMLGYKRGVALWTEDAIIPLYNGLPYNLFTYYPAGAGMVTSQAGLSICDNLSSCIGGTLPQIATLVEFHHSGLDHYFMTLEGAESRAIDAGAAGLGWSQTGYSFKVHADSTATQAAGAACRFYGTPGIGPNSHFYSVNAAECGQVAKDPGWTIETSDAFAATVPTHPYDPLTRTNVADCAGEVPVWRLYNNGYVRNDSNHRYVSDPALYQSMQAAGWKGEGVQFCTLP